jgi:hypothetical protein
LPQTFINEKQKYSLKIFDLRRKENWEFYKKKPIFFSLKQNGFLLVKTGFEKKH